MFLMIVRISGIYFLYEVGTEFFHIVQPVVSLEGVKYDPVAVSSTYYKDSSSL